MIELATLPASDAFLLLSAGLLAGLANAIAGGGTFFTFPVFLSLGLPPVIANASNAVAVWPGHALAVVGYRRELAQRAGSIKGSIAAALIGGAMGAFLLSRIGHAAFSKLIPFLILFATSLFAFGRRIDAWFAARSAGGKPKHPGLGLRLAELGCAVYGGFFGAGLGIMLMAGLEILGVHDVQENNALKNLLAAAATSVGAIVLAANGLVSWPHTLIAFVGATAGGLLGARVARVLPARWLRGGVVAVGLVLSVCYFRQYWGKAI